MDMRLQKYLANCGVASRRKCEELITMGVVKVNDEIVTELGSKVDPEVDRVYVNNKFVTFEEELVYILLHKPEGYISAVEDQFDRETVLDLIDVEERVYPVGRLDYDTSGLLLLTNDGDLTYKLTHPKHDVEKTYIVKVVGEPTEDELEEFRNGLYIDGYKTSKAKVKKIKNDERYTVLEVKLKEGRNRQVRKMFDEIDHRVVELKRIATGKLFLGELKRKEYRFLEPEEVNYLKNLGKE